MNRRSFLVLFLVILSLAASACLFRHKKGDVPARPKTYDVLGTVREASASSITVEAGKGAETFVMNAATVRGGDFKPGMYVHVYYTRQTDRNIATMVVERVK